LIRLVRKAARIAIMNKGIILAGGAGVLLLLAGVASAASGGEDTNPLPVPPTPRPAPHVKTPAEMAEEIRNHELYWGWKESHQFCLYPPKPTTNDPNEINVIAKLHNDACTTAQDHWQRMTSDLKIPESEWDAVIDALGF
jgi:hypothetical protein